MLKKIIVLSYIFCWLFHVLFFLKAYVFINISLHNVKIIKKMLIIIFEFFYINSKLNNIIVVII